MNNTLKVTTPTDREIAMTRVFDAPRRLVFDGLIKPELIKRWLLGPPGWSMPICEIDLKVGGAYRYVWRRDDDGTEMGMGGVYREIVPSEQLVVTEKFDESWYPGEALVTNALVEQDGRTTLTLTILYESREARDAVLKSGTERGLAASYDRLAELVASTQAGEVKSIQATPHPRRLWRSTGAVLLGFFAVVVLSLGTDEVLHLLKVYPPWGKPMHDPGLNLVALAYRIAYAIVGSYIAARFAPNAPMRHAMALGVIGFILSLAGAIRALPLNLGPVWYPNALWLTAWPCAWLGGVLYRVRHAE